MTSKSLRPKNKVFKRALASVVFAVLGRAIKACYKLDTRVTKEFNDFPEGIIIRMTVKPNGPSLILQKNSDSISTLKHADKVDLDIHFKNIDGALMALTGTKSVATCYCENRFLIYGDITLATAFVRIMNLVETYLFPKMWTAYIFDHQAPVRERYAARIYMATIFGK